MEKGEGRQGGGEKDDKCNQNTGMKFSKNK